jgi:hypothetical protein
MNHIPEHFADQYERKYKYFMHITDFAVSLAKDAEDIESIILEAHHEANSRYPGFCLL